MSNELRKMKRALWRQHKPKDGNTHHDRITRVKGMGQYWLMRDGSLRRKA